jgi:hypothetical protein
MCVQIPSSNHSAVRVSPLAWPGNAPHKMLRQQAPGRRPLRGTLGDGLTRSGVRVRTFGQGFLLRRGDGIGDDGPLEPLRSWLIRAAGHSCIIAQPAPRRSSRPGTSSTISARHGCPTRAPSQRSGPRGPRRPVRGPRASVMPGTVKPRTDTPGRGPAANAQPHAQPPPGTTGSASPGQLRVFRWVHCSVGGWLGFAEARRVCGSGGPSDQDIPWWG